MTSSTTPTRGEIWLVDFEPKKGSEIGKVRTALVVSIAAVGKLPLRIVVPITAWNPRFEKYPWFHKLQPTPQNGLSKISGADSFQVKSVSVARFKKRLGSVTANDVEAVVDGISLCVGGR